MSIRISLTMIVKNEAANLASCLESVRDIVDEIIVVDTGSSDNTRDIALHYGAHVFDFPWCDSFAAARNESIRHANGQWIFWLDADEYLDEINRNKLHALFNDLPNGNVAYLMKCLWLSDQFDGQNAIVNYVRLFRKHPDNCWVYRVHEQILPALHRAGHDVRSIDITITHTGYQNPSHRHNKLERNLRLLHLDQSDHPNDPYILYHLGCAYTEFGRHLEAIPLLEESLRFVQSAQVGIDAGEDAVRNSLLLSGLLVRHLLAVLDHMVGEDTEAEFHWKAALSNSPDFRPARLGLAELYLDHERWTDLEALIAEMEQESQTDIEAVVLRGRAHLARREFAAARQVLENTIRQAPHALSPYIVFSHVLMQSGDETAAELLLRQIVQHAPAQAESWHNLAVLYRCQGRIREAIATVQSGRLYNSDNPDLLLLHGILLREGGDLINSEMQLLRLLDTDIGDRATRQRRATVRHNLALVYRAMGRMDGAIAHWNTLMSENSDDLAACLCLAESYLAQGRWGELQPVMDRLEVKAPDALDTMLLRSRFYLACRAYTDAARVLHEVIACFPRCLDARILLSYVRLESGTDPFLAESALLAVLELDPGNAEALHNLDVLRRRYGITRTEIGDPEGSLIKSSSFNGVM